MTLALIQVLTEDCLENQLLILQNAEARDSGKPTSPRFLYTQHNSNKYAQTQPT